MAKVVLAFSGGMDSTVLLSKLRNDLYEVIPVNFSYGSKHNYKERKAARAICYRYGLPLIEINLDFMLEHFKSDLLTSGGSIPEGHYEAESMKSTVVPFRNGIMLSILTGIAESNNCEGVAIAAHSGDHHIYPDCRPEFLMNMAMAINLGTEKGIKLLSPFENMSKSDIAFLGNKLLSPMDLSWTCYKGLDVHCGKCGACTERKEAFQKAGVHDLTEYQ